MLLGYTERALVEVTISMLRGKLKGRRLVVVHRESGVFWISHGGLLQLMNSPRPWALLQGSAPDSSSLSRKRSPFNTAFWHFTIDAKDSAQRNCHRELRPTTTRHIALVSRFSTTPAEQEHSRSWRHLSATSSTPPNNRRVEQSQAPTARQKHSMGQLHPSSSLASSLAS